MTQWVQGGATTHFIPTRMVKRSVPPHFDSEARLAATVRRYRFVGLVVLVLVMVVFLASVLLAIFGDGAADPRLTMVVYGLAVVSTLLAFAVLYLLITVPRLLETRASLDPGASFGRAVQEDTSSPDPTLPSTPIDYGRGSRDVEILEGIGTVFSRRLARAGVSTLDDLRRTHEKQVADAAQVQPEVARRWKFMAELMRARGIDAQAAELLVHCAVVSLDQLAQQEAVPLAQRAKNINQASHNRIYPSDLRLVTVEAWIQAAQAHVAASDERASQTSRTGRRTTGSAA